MFAIEVRYAGLEDVERFFCVNETALKLCFDTLVASPHPFLEVPESPEFV
jgi:hypothetical protein